VKAIDTNVLVYAVMVQSPFHARAREVVVAHAEGADPWAIPWPCVYEFMKVVTHPRVYKPPMPGARARADLGAILSSPSLLLLAETPRHVEVMQEVLAESGAAGNHVHDAHIAALCREHGIEELVTADADFHRFAGFRVTNPFR
jgi:toxin-antitoxin system PIN domain toxin